MNLACTIIGMMSTNEVFFQEKEALISDCLTLHYSRIDENGETEEKQETCSREHFVATVNKAMNSTLTMTIDTNEGKKSITRQFMPVTMIDIPLLNKAMVVLDEVPDFLPKYENGKLSFMFKGDLYDFAMQDKEEQGEN
jgi:hypothetical protein